MATPGAMQCPHCRKSFRAEVLGPNTKHAGYKCPHCKLFVPLGRAEDTEQTGAAA